MYFVPQKFDNISCAASSADFFVFIKNPKIRRKRRVSRTKIAQKAQILLLCKNTYTQNIRKYNKYEAWIYKTCKKIWNLPSRNLRNKRKDLFWDFYVEFRTSLFAKYDPDRACFSIYVDHVASQFVSRQVQKEKKSDKELDVYSYTLETAPEEDRERYSPPVRFYDYVSKQDLPYEIMDPCLRFLAYYIDKKKGERRQQPPVRNANREVVTTTLTRLWREYEKGY